MKCLSLGDDLAYQLKSFLKDNQKANTYFSLTDEKRIWDKLKPDMRQRNYDTLLRHSPRDKCESDQEVLVLSDQLQPQPPGHFSLEAGKAGLPAKLEIGH